MVARSLSQESVPGTISEQPRASFVSTKIELFQQNLINSCPSLITLSVNISETKSRRLTVRFKISLKNIIYSHWIHTVGEIDKWRRLKAQGKAKTRTHQFVGKWQPDHPCRWDRRDPGRSLWKPVREKLPLPSWLEARGAWHRARPLVFDHVQEDGLRCAQISNVRPRRFFHLKWSWTKALLHVFPHTTVLHFCKWYRLNKSDTYEIPTNSSSWNQPDFYETKFFQNVHATFWTKKTQHFLELILWMYTMNTKT